MGGRLDQKSEGSTSLKIYSFSQRRWRRSGHDSKRIQAGRILRIFGMNMISHIIYLMIDFDNSSWSEKHIRQVIPSVTHVDIPVVNAWWQSPAEKQRTADVDEDADDGDLEDASDFAYYELPLF